MRRFGAVMVVLTVLVAAGFLMKPSGDLAATITNGNVMIYYGPYYASTIPASNAQIYDGSSWHPSTNDGVLVKFSKDNQDYLRLSLVKTKHEQVVKAYANYGTAHTPTFQHISWNDHSPVPFVKAFKTKAGQHYQLTLSSVFVLAFEPGVPIPNPNLREGCDNVSCGK